MNLRSFLFCLALPLSLLWAREVQAAPIAIVAAESTYGVIAQAIGGDQVKVDSIINNPNVDPHSFEATPAVARKVAQAQIVLLNGIGYDDWMRKMLAANPTPHRQVIVAAELDPARIMADRNPHVFYDPLIALKVAEKLTQLLQQADPAHRQQFASNLRRFKAELARLNQAQAALAHQYPRLQVTATEPVVGYLLRQLGWTSLGEKFQFDVMNDTEPSPAEVARYEDHLRQHKVALLFYNRQVTDPLTDRLRNIALDSGVPVVGVDEFVPPRTGYVQWQLQTLAAIDRALGKSH
ncbi:MAG: zinc ABC transporter substrate-binding protein [Thiomonas sp.]|uniref:metal ABC transporter solute-binding protein, Zn/Mn family n=1 Tax=Thiomonas sp. TaxID=2047785 RepID=UPI002A35E3F7|nr:zinc ABC transporter substrate-binding protein [Thiomonas sp.]MDY0329888.1 zinc ABC transporter substrate-binding protein [Thiomonas sp.]